MCHSLVDQRAQHAELLATLHAQHAEDSAQQAQQATAQLEGAQAKLEDAQSRVEHLQQENITCQLQVRLLYMCIQVSSLGL